MSINTLVIGLGKVGMGYDSNVKNKKIKSHSKAIRNNRNFKLSGGVDIDDSKREKFKKHT